MASRVIGIDIADDFFTAAALEKKGSAIQLVSWNYILRDQAVSRAEQLKELLAPVDCQGYQCILGLPLSALSLRNISIPFKEPRKIRQVLPFELEDQLLTPVADQEIDFVITGQGDSASQLLVAAVAKDFLDELVQDLRECSLSIRNIVVSAASLARACIMSGRYEDSALLVHGDGRTLSTVLWHARQPVFMRRLLVDSLLADFPEYGVRDGIEAIAVYWEQQKQERMRLCRHIAVNLSYLRQNTGQDFPVNQIVVSGLAGFDSEWADTLEEVFQVPAVILEPEAVVPAFAGKPGENVAGRSKTLALPAMTVALEGVGKKSQKPFLEFGRDRIGGWPELIRTVRSKRVLTGAAALFVLVMTGISFFLWKDYQRLVHQHRRYKEEMTALFRKNFPDVKRIVDPELQMRTRLRELRQSKGQPLLETDRRVLNILAELSSRIPAGLDFQVSRLVIDTDGVQFRGMTAAFNDVDLIKGRLAASPLFSRVTIVSAAMDKKSGKIRFEIKLQLGQGEQP